MSYGPSTPDKARVIHCFKMTESGDVCALPKGHPGRCGWNRKDLVAEYRGRDARRDYFRLWQSKEKN